MRKIFQLLSLIVIASFMTVAIPVHAQISGAGGKRFVQEYIYDFAVDGGAVGTISLLNPANRLPSGAVVLSAHYTVLTAFTSAGSATVSLGDAASSARYLALTAYNNAAFDADVPKAIATGVPVAVSSANISNVSLTVAVAALTAGKLRFVIEGYVPKGQ